MNALDYYALSDCLKLLAACFYEPDCQYMAKEKLGPKLVSAFEHTTPDLFADAKLMVIALRDMDPEQLKVDYAGLFIGPFELAAPPYGSVYLESTRRIMGDSTMDVLRQYQDAGLTVEIAGPPDHIAIELEFLYFLCFKIADSLQAGNDHESEKLQRKLELFLGQSFLPWIPNLCLSIRQGTENIFYRALANCLEGTGEHLSTVIDCRSS